MDRQQNRRYFMGMYKSSKYTDKTSSWKVFYMEDQMKEMMASLKAIVSNLMRNMLGHKKVHHLTTETGEVDQVVRSPLDHDKVRSQLDRDKVRKLDAVFSVTRKPI